MNSITGSLHTHGFWTDYRNPNETARAPFNLKYFVGACIKYLDFQAITDIMSNWPEWKEFTEHRYSALLATADPKDKDLHIENNGIEARVWLYGNEFTIPRTQEILTNKHFKHILVAGVKEDIFGGRNARDTLKEIKDKGGYAILDHPFMCDAWTEEEVLDLYDKKLIQALEWNGGLTFPSWLPKFLRKKTPNRESNHRVLALADKIPVIANDDAHCVDDLKRGAKTSYNIISGSPKNINLIDYIFQSIERRDFQRHERYSAFTSPIHHVKYGAQSQKMFGKDGLPPA
ncbi:MAG: hypothetical protein Q8L29_02195 [archaeon]|nr:hypothetical protein [archaeon]